MVDPEDRDKRITIRWSWCVADSNDVSPRIRIGGKYFHSEGVERAIFLQCLQICPRIHGAAYVARSSGCATRRKMLINNSLGRNLNGDKSDLCSRMDSVSSFRRCWLNFLLLPNIRDEWERDSESIA